MSRSNGFVAYPIESVGNALRIVHLLRESKELRVTHVARQLGVAPSTAHRLMAMLVQYGFAKQTTRRTYVRGWALPEQVQTSLSDVIRAHARPTLVAVGKGLGETVHLVQRKGTAAVFLEGVEPAREGGSYVSSRAGLSMYAHATAAGKAILAGLGPAELVALYPRGLPRTYGPGARDMSTLTRQLKLIRQQGYSVSDEEGERGVVGIAAGIRGPNETAEWSVAVGIPVLRCPDSRIPEVAQRLREAAREIGIRISDLPEVQPVDLSTAS